MDDLDNFFGEEAANAFVDGLNFDMGGQAFDPAMLNTEGMEVRHEFAQAMLENDELLNSSVFGDNYEKDFKNGVYAKLDKAEVINLLYSGNLAGELYPKDSTMIEKLVTEDYLQDKYNEQDIATIARQLIALHMYGDFQKKEEEESKIVT